MARQHVFSFTLPAHEAKALLEWCLDRGHETTLPPTYAAWKIDGPGFNIVAYRSGKVVIQGKEADELVRYTVENICPSIVGATDAPLREITDFHPHAGLDESGKGDFFGPLVIACAFVDTPRAEALAAAGVKDCKLINDKELHAIDTKIRRILTAHGFSTVVIGCDAYNRLYEKFRNLNRLLAWGHARALENILEKNPECPMALADQFGNPELIRRALLEKGRGIRLEQRHKAESDIAVAAASIIARAEFLRRLDALGKGIGTPLPKGAGDPVLRIGRTLWRQHPDPEFFNTIAKRHFTTFTRIQSDA